MNLETSLSLFICASVMHFIPEFEIKIRDYGAEVGVFASFSNAVYGPLHLRCAQLNSDY